MLFVKPHQCFLMVDEFEAVPGIVSALQWNLHSWNEFDVDEQERRFTLEREGSALVGHIMCHFNAFFSRTEGWDPPPSTAKDSAQWYQQYHSDALALAVIGGRAYEITDAGLQAIE